MYNISSFHKKYMLRNPDNFICLPWIFHTLNMSYITSKIIIIYLAIFRYFTPNMSYLPLKSSLFTPKIIPTYL